MFNIYTICYQPLPESSHMLTIWQFCTLQATRTRERELLLRTLELYILISRNGSSSSVQLKQYWQYFTFTTRRASMGLKLFSKGRFYLFVPNHPTSVKKLDSALMFHRHLESLRKTLTSRVGILRRLARSSWGASATALRTGAFALIHSTAEYCTPI